MAKQPKRAIKLFGTEVPEPKVKTLQAGALSAVFDNGALWLYAHRADKKGELAWKSFLADDPPGGYNPWTSTGLAVAGGDRLGKTIVFAKRSVRLLKPARCRAIASVRARSATKRSKSLV